MELVQAVAVAHRLEASQHWEEILPRPRSPRSPKGRGEAAVQAAPRAETPETAAVGVEASPRPLRGAERLRALLGLLQLLPRNWPPN